MNALPDYKTFLREKHVRPAFSGFSAVTLPEKLFDWQREVVRWLCERGRAALFAGTGLGKTFMQLAWADQVCRLTNRPVLILCPLAVGPQTVREAQKLGSLVHTVRLAKDQADVSRHGIWVTNYQKLIRGKFDPSVFSGVVLDESSILKSFMGTTKRALCDAFASTPYRLCATATPAPNDHMELGNHSQFLGVMDSDEMLSRWFINDPANVGSYRLKGHAEADYWAWVAEWALCVDMPSDLGYPDDGYTLPPLHTHEHIVTVDTVGRGLTDGAQRLLVPNDKLTATALHREMRLTAYARAAKVAELVQQKPDVPWVVWCNTDYEAVELMKQLPAGKTREIKGGQTDSVKERLLSGFIDQEFPILVTKPSIAGHGLNLQFCRDTAVCGLSYSHEQFFQLVRRFWRFGQTEEVNCHVVTAETEGPVLRTIKAKERQHYEMRDAMRTAAKTAWGNRTIARTLTMPEQREESGKTWKLLLGDCVERTKEIPADSVGLSVFSPPFAGLYIYSASEADMGNAADDREFLRHFGYLVPELYRVTIPGRLCVVHCKDLPKYAGRDDVAGLKDFPGWLIAEFERHGWTYHSRVTIWKCPVVERERTNNNGLLHKTVCRDSSQTRQGMADYVVVFRRPPLDSDGLLSASPIERTNGLERYVGDPAFDPRVCDSHPSPHARRSHAAAQSIDIWRRYAEPVWWDIDQMDVLNKKEARDDRDEKHICPLQLGVIRRAVHLWSNPGDLVYSPFAGIGSEGYVAIQEGRRFVGCELKESYFRQAARTLAATEDSPKQADLFASIPVKEECDITEEVPAKC